MNATGMDLNHELHRLKRIIDNDETSLIILQALNKSLLSGVQASKIIDILRTLELSQSLQLEGLL